MNEEASQKVRGRQLHRRSWGLGRGQAQSMGAREKGLSCRG